MMKKCVFCGTVYHESGFFCPKCSGLVYDLIEDDPSLLQAEKPEETKPEAPVVSPKLQVISPSYTEEEKPQAPAAPVQEAQDEPAVPAEEPEAAPEVPAQPEQPEEGEDDAPADAPSDEEEADSLPKPEDDAEDNEEDDDEDDDGEDASGDLETLYSQLEAIKPMQMMSWYDGDSPLFAPNKATGKLEFAREGVIYHKQMGNSMGSMFGIAGMMMAKKKAQKDGKEAFFPYEEIKEARFGRVSLTPALVLELSDGTTYSFSGLSSSASIKKAVRVINGVIAALQNEEN